MSKDTILKIREAEEEAARILESARVTADTMRRDAEAAGRELCRSTEEELSQELSGMLEQLRERAAEMSARVLDETREEAAAVAGTARLNRKSAEKIVIRGLDAKCR